MKNKRLMGIIGLIAAAVIGTAIYSATAGKDNKAASSKKRLRWVFCSWSATLRLI